MNRYSIYPRYGLISLISTRGHIHGYIPGYPYLRQSCKLKKKAEHVIACILV